MTSSSNSFEALLVKTRIQFLFDHPFLSVLALSLPVVWKKRQTTLFATDGWHIYIDESHATRYDASHITYLYGHILLHILLKHASRMKGRNQPLWNRACDIAINLLMEDFTRVGIRPSDEVYLPQFANQSVEAIYATLYKEDPEGEGTPDETNPQEQKRDLIEGEGTPQATIQAIDALIVQALTAAQKAGALPASLLESIHEITRPKINLEAILEHYLLQSFFYKQSDFSRPNRRYIHQNLYLPGSTHTRNRLELFIALDRSMSIRAETFSAFLGIIDRVVRLGLEVEITVVPFDTGVDENAILRFDTQTKMPTMAMHKGNGGTHIAPLFDYVQTHAPANAQLIVLTDGLFAIDRACTIPTLFLISDTRNQKLLERFGTVIFFEE